MTEREELEQKIEKHKAQLCDAERLLGSWQKEFCRLSLLIRRAEDAMREADERVRYNLMRIDQCRSEIDRMAQLSDRNVAMTATNLCEMEMSDGGEKG